MENGPDPCAGCVYQTLVGGDLLCDYIMKTGHRRPCPFGMGCTVKETRGGEPMRTINWDQERAMTLFEEGKSDLEIAQAVGTTKIAIQAWRSRNRLLKQAAPAAEASTQPPAPPDPDTSPPEVPKADPPPEAPEPDPPPEAPVAGPVELCLELEGGWARLRARSWAQAAKLWQMLHVCVEALEREGGDG